MHKLFADWYSIANLEFDENKLEKRWNGIEKIARKRKSSVWIDCVRLFLGHSKKKIEYSNEFENQFKEEDAAFLTQDNKVELQVLAGAAIANKIKNRSKAADISALAVTCAFFNGKGSDILIPHVIKECAKYISRRKYEIREFKSKNEENVTINDETNVGYTKKIGDVSSGNNRQNREGINTLKQKVDDLVNNVNKITKEIGDIKKSINTIGSNDYISKKVKRLEEETNILWWLFGEHSRDLEKPFEEIGLPSVVIVLGKELADLTEFPLSIPTAAPILEKALQLSGYNRNSHVTLHEVISATSEDWRENWVNGLGNISQVKDLVPVLRAVDTSLSTPDDWVDVYNEKSSFSCSEKIAPDTLSEQVYNECLLAKMVDQS